MGYYSECTRLYERRKPEVPGVLRMARGYLLTEAMKCPQVSKGKLNGKDVYVMAYETAIAGTPGSRALGGPAAGAVGRGFYVIV